MKQLNNFLLLGFIALSLPACVNNGATISPQTALEISKAHNIKSLKVAMDHFKQLQIEGHFKKSIDYIYPPVFEKIPKDKMIEGFDALKEGPFNPDILKFEQKANLPIKVYSRGIYTTIPYTIQSSIDMTPPKSDKARSAQLAKLQKNPKRLESFKSFTIMMLKTLMGKKADIKFQKDSMVIDINKSDTYLAINEDKLGWKFVDFSTQLLSQIKDVLPQDIIESEKALFDELSKDTVDPMKAMMEAISQKTKNKK